MVSYKAEYLRVQKELTSVEHKLAQYESVCEKLESVNSEKNLLEWRVAALETELKKTKIELSECREESGREASTSNYSLTTVTYIDCESVVSVCYPGVLCKNGDDKFLYTNGCFNQQVVYDSEGKKMEPYQILDRQWKDKVASEVSEYYGVSFEGIRKFLREHFPKETCPKTRDDYASFVDRCWEYGEEIAAK